MPDPDNKARLPDIIPRIALTTLIVAMLGYIDYITGEVSIDILYIVCLCFVTWFTDTSIGLLCVMEILTAKVTADYLDHIKVGTHLYEWNALNFLPVYLVICLLAGKLKKVLTL